MIRGIYTGASGMVAEALRTDVISNNLANANTAGYKKDVTINKEFGEVMMSRLNDGETAVIGKSGTGVTVDEVATIYSGGSPRNTGNSFDLALDGRGFFVVETPNGRRYTRNGTFAKNIRGELITQDGYRVLGRNGRPVVIRGTRMDISPEGNVVVDNTPAGTLDIVDFANTKQLTKEGSSLFAAAQGQEPARSKATVQQGFLEMSNVNVVGEMVNLISNYRAYEINGKVIQSHDQMISRAVNDVGKL